MAAKELVDDMKLMAEIHPEGTYHPTFEPEYIGGIWSQKREFWKKEKALGQGAYGKVWLEQCTLGEGHSKLRAVKRIRKPKNPSHMIYCEQELEAFAKFSQQKYTGLFVKSLGWFEDESSIFIAMEHIKLGDLSAHLSGPLPEDEVRQISAQVLQGLNYLHINRFVHRDLKPANVFVMSAAPRWWVKIGDFGFSKRHDENIILQSEVGTRPFLAPEILQIYPPGTGEKNAPQYTGAVDMWAFGIMAFYLLCNAYPFPSLGSLLTYGQTLRFPSSHLLNSLNPGVREFLISFLAVDATSRLSARQALESAWLKGYAPNNRGQIEKPASLNSRSTGIHFGSGEIYASSGSEAASRGWADVDQSSMMNAKILSLSNESSGPRKPQDEPIFFGEMSPNGTVTLVEDNRLPFSNGLPRHDLTHTNQPGPVESSTVTHQETQIAPKGVAENLKRLRELNRAIGAAKSSKFIEPQDASSTGEQQGQLETPPNSTTPDPKAKHARSGELASEVDFAAMTAEEEIMQLREDRRKMLARDREAKTNDPVTAPPANPTIPDTKTKQASSGDLTAKIESDVMSDFRRFAEKEKMKVMEKRRNKAARDREVKIDDLVKFSREFQLATPVPKDLVPILSKDPHKQK